MGCAAGMNYDTFKQMLKKNFSLLLTATVVCTAFFIFFIIPRQQYLDWNVSEILRSSYMMLTILTLFAAALKVNSLRIFISRPVLWLDKNSYTVYLYHMICLMAVNYVLDKIGITGVLKRFPLKFIFTFALTFAVCLFIEQLKRLILKNKKITTGA